MVYYIGIDIQTIRGCPFWVLNRDGKTVDKGWVPPTPISDIPGGLAAIAERYARNASGSTAVGIDAPRLPLTAPREFNWNSNTFRLASKESG